MNFFDNLVEDIGYCPSIWYAIPRFLYTIGFDYLNQGVGWLAALVNSEYSSISGEWIDRALYYIEDAVLRLTTEKTIAIKKDKRIKKQLLSILDWLVERGSTVGFLLREERY